MHKGCPDTALPDIKLYNENAAPPWELHFLANPTTYQSNAELTTLGKDVGTAIRRAEASFQSQRPPDFTSRAWRSRFWLHLPAAKTTKETVLLGNYATGLGVNCSCLNRDDGQSGVSLKHCDSAALVLLPRQRRRGVRSGPQTSWDPPFRRRSTRCRQSFPALAIQHCPKCSKYSSSQG